MEEQRDRTLLAILQQVEGKSLAISSWVCQSCEKMTVVLNRVRVCNRTPITSGENAAERSRYI
jgi:hypothetical protein